MVNKTRNGLNNNWNFPKGVFIVFLVFIMGLFGVYVLLAISPTIYGRNMDDFAANRNTVKTILTANRGTIYDSEKKILAVNVSSYNVIAYLSASRTGSSPKPLHVIDKHLTAEKLAPILKMEVKSIENLLNNDLYQVELGPGGRGITELTKEEIVALQLPGIDFIENSKRYYPNGDFASYLIGYAKQYEKNVPVNGVLKTEYSIVGELGIESKYNNLLQGTNGYLQFQKDRFGYKIPDTKEIRQNPVDGSDIYLTLDSNIQRFLEDAVKESAAIYNPEWLMLTAMDAKTGDILGSASTPSFNPNTMNIVNYENPLTSYVFEPGSTMKIYTFMCAIDKGTYQGSTTYASGQFKIGSDTVNDWNQKGWGIITYDKGFEYSSNVSVANLLSKYINKADLKSCLTKFGFGKATGIELARELSGQISFNYPIEVTAAGFGQGITTTAIQHLQALSIVANNGSMVTPHAINKIFNPNTGKTTYQREIVKSAPLVKTSTVKKIKELMFNTVNGTDAGTTARSYHIEGFNIIGKTGTAQIFDNATGKYLTDQNDFIYSFAGMFPGDDPDIIIYAAVKKPTWGTSGAISKATKAVIKSIATYLNIYDQKVITNSMQEIEMGSYINKHTTAVQSELKALGFDVVVIGKGDTIIKQNPNPTTKLLTNDKIILLTNDSILVMPSLKGWSRLEAVSFFDLINLKYELNGFGYVITQSIATKTILKGDEIIKLDLAKKYNLDIIEE